MEDAENGRVNANTVCFGDIIVISLSQSVHTSEGYLAAEGLVTDEVYVLKDSFECIEDCLWEVCVQNQYSAAADYDEILNSKATDSVEVSHHVTGIETARQTSVKYTPTAEMDIVKPDDKTIPENIYAQYQLHRAAINEVRINEKLMAMKAGKSVLFGEPIQLRHYKSRKYLDVARNLLAKNEKENMKVSLSTYGTIHSHLCFAPRSKYDKEGSAVKQKDELNIKVIERVGEYLHAAKKSAAGYSDGRKELNCSLESTTWTASTYRYNNYSKYKEKKICPGHIITIQDTDSLSYLKVSKNGRDGKTSTIELSHAAVSVGTYEDVGTHLLWLVEKENHLEGGDVLINGDRVTLRDLNTRLYLRMTPEGLYGVSSHMDASSLVLFNEPANLNDNLFWKEEINFYIADTNGYYLSYKSTTEVSTSTSHGNPAQKNDTKLNFECCGKFNMSSALTFVASSALLRNVGTDVYVGVDAAANLRVFASIKESKEDKYAALAAFTRSMIAMLEMLRMFISTEGKFSVADERTMRSPGMSSVVDYSNQMYRQTMMREQGVIDLLLDIIDLCDSHAFDMIKNATSRSDVERGSVSLQIRDLRRGASGLMSRKESAKANNSQSNKIVDDDNQMGKKNSDPAVTTSSSAKTSINSLDLLSNISKLVTISMKKAPESGRVSNRDSPATPVRKNSVEINKPATSSWGNFLRRPRDAIIRRGSGNVQMQTPGSFEATSNTVSSSSNVVASSLIQVTPANRVSLRRSSTTKLADAVKPIGGVDEKAELGTITTSQEVARACFRVLLICIKESHMNQVHISDRFNTIMNHVKYQPAAVRVLEEIFSDNLHIIQTKIRQNEIDMLVNMLVTTEMSVTFIKLLQSTCTCPIGVDSTQRMVVQALFGKEVIGTPSNSVVINVLPSLTMKDYMWAKHDVYFPKDPATCTDTILCYDVLTKGLPQVLLTWRSSDKYSLIELFGSNDPVPFHVLAGNIVAKKTPLMVEETKVEEEKKQTTERSARRSMNVSNRRISIFGGRQSAVVQKLSDIFERKRQVAHFLVAELYLVADLCIDRNYVSINILEKIFRYDVLISILKDEFIPNKFKAPVCRILRCMYVDREPQVAVNYPRLVRTFCKIGSRGNAKEETDDHNSSPYMFAVLQSVISDYLSNGLNLFRCDEFSSEMMDLLQNLIRFGFYSSVEQLNDVIGPLISSLNVNRFNSNQASRLTDVTKKSTVKPDHASKKENTGLLHNLIQKYCSFITAICQGVSSKLSFLYRDARNAHNNSMEKIPWEKRWLLFNDSIIGMCIVLLVVLVAVSLSVVRLWVTSIEAGALVFDYVITSYFIFEYSLRLYCYYRIYNATRPFLMDKFNIGDLCLILLDLILIGIGTSSLRRLGNAARVAKIFRIMRLLRLIRLIRAAKLVRKIVDESSKVVVWVPPARYANVTAEEAETIVSMLKVLSMIYDRILDKNLGVCVSAFVEWMEENSAATNLNPMVILRKVKESNDDLLPSIPQYFDDILLDILMYKDTTLTQEALNLLMVHNTRRKLWIETAQHVQIIYSHSMANKSKVASRVIREIQRLAEMYEIWGELSSEQSQKSAADMLDLINHLFHLLTKTVDKWTLDTRIEILVDGEMQLLLKNLDAFSTFMFVNETLFAGGTEELQLPIIKILQALNKLIVAFTRHNMPNQMIAFRSLQWFIDRIDSGIGAAGVIKSIVAGNRKIILNSPRKIFKDMINKIVANGKTSAYLHVLLAYVDSEPGANDINAVQMDISRLLSGREIQNHIYIWFDPPGSQGYIERSQEMEVYRYNDAQQTESMFSEKMQYHVTLLRLLSSCKLGIKLQAIYPFESVIACITDPVTVLAVKVPLANLLLELILSNIEGLIVSEAIWNLVDHIAYSLEMMQTELNTFLNYSCDYRIVVGEWIVVSLRILEEFFTLFDIELFEELILDEEITLAMTENTELEILNVCKRIYSAIRILLDGHPNLVGDHVRKCCYATLQAVCIHNETLFFDREFDATVTTREKPKRGPRFNTTFADIQQEHFREKFAFFSKSVAGGEKYLESDAVDLFERIPRLETPNINVDVRYEPLINKLTSHFRTSIKRIHNTRVLDKDIKDTSIWFLQTLRYQLEKYVGISIDSNQDKLIKYEIAPETEEAAKLREIYNDHGITYLCLELLANGIDHQLMLEAIKMLLIMLFKVGGSAVIQQNIYTYLVETDSSHFFECVKEIIGTLFTWSNKYVTEKDIVDLKTFGSINDADQTDTETNDEKPPHDILIFYLLQLLCEGLYMPFKHLAREQESNTRQVNILDSLAEYSTLLSRIDNHASHLVSIAVLKAISKLLQGPCKANQEYFVMNTEILVTLNRFMRIIRPQSKVHEEQESETLNDLLHNLVDVLRMVSEGQPKNSQVFERVMTIVELNVLNVIVLPTIDISEENSLVSINAEFTDFELTDIQATYLVFLKGLKQSRGILSSIAEHKLMTDVQCIEVQYQDQIHNLCFPVPTITKFINPSSHEKFMTDLDVTSQETKLLEFTKSIKQLHREAAHSQSLSSLGFSNLWSIKTKLTWFMFVNAVIMNCLILTYYGTIDSKGETNYAAQLHRGLAVAPSDDFSPVPGKIEIANDLFMEDNVQTIIGTLNIIQVVLISITIFIIFIVRIPVTYETYLEKNLSKLEAVLNTMSDPIPVWYCFYLVICLISLVYNYLFVSILLLDFVVLDSTTQDVLYAIQAPFRQLVATLIIILIIINIFSGVIFVAFRPDIVYLEVHNMWDTFKMAISYGIRGEYGVSHEMNLTLGNRLILDMVFYFIVLAILRHIFFAIIVDTFGKLRELKFERETQMNNCCFICGVERHDFDKQTSAGKQVNFNSHRTVTHSVDNYINFIMHIWDQSSDNDNSIESYVRTCLQHGDISWFPIGVVTEFFQSVITDKVVDSQSSENQRGNHNNQTGGHNNSSSGHGNGGGHGGGNGGGHGGAKSNKRMSTAKAKFENVITTTEDGQQQPVVADTFVTEKLNFIEKMLNKLTANNVSTASNNRASLIVPNRVLAPSVSTIEDTSPVSSPQLPKKSNEIPATTSLSPDMGLLLQKITEMNSNLVTVSSRLDKLERTNEEISNSRSMDALSPHRDQLVSSSIRSGSPTNLLISRKELGREKWAAAATELSSQSGFLKQSVQVQGPSKELLRTVLSPAKPAKVNISSNDKNA